MWSVFGVFRSCILISLVNLHEILANNADPDIIDELSEQHASTCASCRENNDVHEGDRCCGFCTCDSKCFQHGSCCLGQYSSFRQALNTVKRTRHDCVISQYVPLEKTGYNTDKAYWMVTRCSPEYTDIDTQNKCENPGSNIDSIIPVSDPLSLTHYRNIFCAYCNDVSRNVHLIRWHLQIDSNQKLSFPNLNLLADIQGDRGNIFFIPPKYIQVPTCDSNLSYNISTCNETGLWRRFDSNIESACNSFWDPFNYTYKNYFCYVCNNDENLLPEPKDWMCNKIDIEKNTAEFSSFENLYSVTGDHIRDPLVCGDTEFEDEKAMVCRHVVCSNDRQLSNGECLTTTTNYNVTCSSVFLKLTAENHDSESTLPFNLIGRHIVTMNILTAFKEAVGWHYNIITFLTFFKLDTTDHIDYVVIYTETAFDNSYQKDEYIASLIQIEILYIVYYGEHEIEFSVDLGTYNLTIETFSAKILVPSKVNMSVDELTVSLDQYDASVCPSYGTTPINKLSVCPYINVGIHELTFEIQNDLLMIYSDEKPVISLTKWEYETRLDSVSICFDDFIHLYEELSLGGRCTTIHTKQILFLATVCLVIMKSVIF